MHRIFYRARHGFTLIELLVVLAVLALLTGLITPNYLDRVSQAREVTLKTNLAGLRTAIDQFYRDKGRYPNELADLVESRYIREVPQDPVTERSDTWIAVPPKGAASAAGKVFDVKSGATGQAKDGASYSAW